MADIDNLSIRISASAGTAIKNIDRLTNSLRSLNAELGRINPSGLAGVANAASSFGNAMSSIRPNARTLQTAVNAFTNIGNSSGQMAQLGDASQRVSDSVQRITSNVTETARATNSASSQTQNLGNALNNVSNNANHASRSMRNMARNTSSTKSSFKGLTKELGRITKMLKLMITRMVLRKVIQGVLDGFKNLAQYSKTFDSTLSLLWNSFRQLGNSIAAAVSPLLNALAPALNYIIQLVIKAVNVINQLISALTGMGTWTRAKKLTDSYAASLDKSNKSAKALKKTVLGFDELNQLQDNNSGGGGGTSPADMFEQVPIDPRILKFVDDMKKKIGELKKYWGSFKKGFSKGLGDDWKDKVDLIVDGAARIQKAMDDIWNDPKVSQARDRYLESTAEMLGTVAGTATRIGLNIGANVAQGVADSLEEKSPEIKAHLEEMFDIGTSINNQVSDFAVAVGEISDVLIEDNAIAATKELNNIYTEAFMLVEENAARTGEAIAKLLTQPVIDNKDAIKTDLDEMFGTLATLGNTVQNVIKDIRDTVSDVWEQHLNPMFDSLTKGFSDLSSKLLDVWHNNIQPVLDEAVEAIKPLWEQYIKPIADDIAHIIGIIGNLLAKLFQNVIVPIFGSLLDTWMPRIQDSISRTITIVKLTFQTVSTIVQAITFVLRSFLQFFETGFTQGWGAACEEIANSWANEWEAMLEKVKGIGYSIIEFVEKIINSIIRGINSIGDKIGNLGTIKLPAMFGGETLDFSSLKFHISDVHLFSGGGGRGFKNGGFPEDGLFFANHNEMVGRFSNGRTAVANNEQITNGIAQAVYSAMVSAQSSGGGQYINNTIMVDGEVLARTVTKGQEKMNRRYSPTMA